MWGGERKNTNVGLRVLEVDPEASDVEVTAVNDGLLGVVGLDELEESGVPLLPEWPVRQVLARVWHVAAHDVERLELRRDQASLGVELGDAHSLGHRDWLDLAEYGSPVLPWLVTFVKDLLVSGQDIFRRCALRDLRLLEAQDVRFLGFDVVLLSCWWCAESLTWSGREPLRIFFPPQLPAGKP